jgi:SAM-dependent methyltransferase
MLDSRPSAVSEIKRILKPDGRAYLSLGSPPPLGQVNNKEWEETLKKFKVLGRGGILQKWALVTL